MKIPRRLQAINFTVEWVTIVPSYTTVSQKLNRDQSLISQSNCREFDLKSLLCYLIDLI
jgi:hypothetical protein